MKFFVECPGGAIEGRGKNETLLSVVEGKLIFITVTEIALPIEVLRDKIGQVGFFDSIADFLESAAEIYRSKVKKSGVLHL